METTPLTIPAIPPGTPGWWLIATALMAMLSLLWQVAQLMQKALRERAEGRRLDVQASHKERRDDFAIVRDELRLRIEEIRADLATCRAECASERTLRIQLEDRVRALERRGAE